MDSLTSAATAGVTAPERMSRPILGAFHRDRLPEPVNYYESEGLVLVGRGKWRTARCEFHGGSDSMRINTATGGWVCMACGVKGGDVLAYAMQAHLIEFIDAARSLGAWEDDGTQRDASANKPATLSPRQAMEVVAFELLVAVLVIGDIRNGLIPSDADWTRFREAAGRIEALATEFRT